MAATISNAPGEPPPVVQPPLMSPSAPGPPSPSPGLLPPSPSPTLASAAGSTGSVGPDVGWTRISMVNCGPNQVTPSWTGWKVSRNRVLWSTCGASMTQVKRPTAPGP